MNRRGFLRTLLRPLPHVLATTAAGFVLVGRTHRCQAQTRRTKRFANLQEQLKFGLKARRPQEFLFIRRVVDLVEKKKLPRKVVLAAFNWARYKKPYPFPYFVRAMQILAARYGVKIGGADVFNVAN